MLLVAISCACLALFYLITFVRPRQPPDHPGGWIWNTYFMGLKNESLWVKVLKLANDCTEYGGLTRLLAGATNYYVITDPDVIVGVLNVCLDKGIFYRFWKPWLGDGAVTASVPIWKPHRKLLNPLFHQRIMDEYLLTFNKQAERLVRNLSSEVGKGPFDPFPYLAVVNLETICLTSFGFSEDVSTLRKYSEAVQEINKLTRYRFERFWLHSHFVYSWSSLKRTEDELLKTIHNMSYKLINKRKAILKERSNGKKSDLIDSKVMFIDTLLEMEANKLYTEKQVREEVDTFLFGGHDSVSTTIMYTLVLLGSYPAVQDKVYKELQEVLGDSQSTIMLEDLSKLLYLEAVVKESMRLYPFAPFISRIVDADVKLKNCTLSAGSTLFILLYGTHRLQIWGADAEQFRPERWLESTTPNHPAAFCGFSWGKRSCIGKPYAMMVLKTTLAHLIRHYTFAADHTKLRFELDVVLKPLCGQHVAVQIRNKS